MSKRNSQTRYNTFESVPLFLDAIDISIVLGIPKTDAYFMLHAGDFPAITIGGRVLVRKEKLFAWLDQHKSIDSLQRSSATSSNSGHNEDMITPKDIKEEGLYE